jgi:hypothetical protein
MESIKRELNEQWIGTSREDNKLHMFKAVEPHNHEDYICSGCDMACSSYHDEPMAFCNAGDEILDYCQFGSHFRIKDLGIVDERGYLPEERTGMYPDIIYLGGNEFLESSWVAQVDDEVDDIHVTVYGDTEEEVKFKWNKRS